MTQDAEKLYQLAKRYFTNLSLVEDLAFKKLCQGITLGKIVNFSSRNENDNDPAKSKNWTAGRLLKSEWFIWLCTNQEAAALIPQKGFHIRGARIVGHLDLGFSKILFPIHFNRCSMSHLIFYESEVRQLCLSGSHIESLYASGIKTSSLLLNDGLKSDGEIDLLCAVINGDLDCTGSQFKNPGNKALIADGLNVGGNVYLRNGFKIEGELRLPGAKIGRDIDCSNSQFSNPHGVAFFADGIEVGNGVFLRNLKVEGEARLPGARIGGDLDCQGGEFNNPGNNAFSAFGIKVDDSVFLVGVKANGAVQFVNMTIGGNFECEGAQLFNLSGMAFNIAGIEVKNGLYLKNGFKAKGIISLVGANLGTHLDLSGLESPDSIILDLRNAKCQILIDSPKSWPTPGKLLLFGFTYDAISVESPIDAKSRIIWLRRQPASQYSPQPYEQLAETLRYSGHEEAAVEVLIEKNRNATSHLTKFSLTWLWHQLFDWFAGYGYRPRKAFGWSLGFIIFGAILFHFGHEHGWITPTKAEAYEEKGSLKISVNYPVFNSLIYSMENFVPLIKLQVADSYAPNANLGKMHTIVFFHSIPPLSTRNGSLLRDYLWFHIIAGWFLTTLWVGGLTGLIRR
jgi:hypothetical protein